jgi:hypothetical protein
MSSEVAGRRELTQSVTNHVFTDKNLFEDLAIVDHKGVSDKFWWNLTLTSPSLDGFFFVCDLETLNFDSELFVYVRSFFATSRHK